MIKLDSVREAMSGIVPKSLLLGIPLFLQSVSSKAATLDSSALSDRGFRTEIGVSPKAMANSFADELRTYGAEPAAVRGVSEAETMGPGPFTRLIKALRGSVGKGVGFTGRKHAGIHLKSIFSMDRGAFMKKALGWANKGTHSVLLVSDDAAAKLANKGIDKLDELNGLMRGKSLADVPIDETIRLSGGSTVRRSKFYGSSEKLSVTVPAKELGVGREVVGIFDAKAYKTAVDNAVAAGRDPKLIDPSTFSEPAKNVDELTFVFFGQLGTGQKLVNGLLTMFPRAERVAIGGLLLTGTAGTAKASVSPLGGTTADERVQQVTAEHLANFAASAGLSEEIDITSTWDKLTESGAEIGAQIAVDWGLVAALGSRVGGVLSFILMPQTLNGGEGAFLEFQQAEFVRNSILERLDDVTAAMVGDISEQISQELKDAGYPAGCDFGEKARPNIERAVRHNLDVLLSR